MLAEYPQSAINGYLDHGDVALKRWDLHYQGGGSDKVYIVVLYKDTLSSYGVLALYGRRGNGLTTQFVERQVPLSVAEASAFSKVQSKIKKGYGDVGMQALGGNQAKPAGGNSEYHKPGDTIIELNGYQLGPISVMESAHFKHLASDQWSIEPVLTNDIGGAKIGFIKILWDSRLYRYRIAFADQFKKTIIKIEDLSSDADDGAANSNRPSVFSGYTDGEQFIINDLLFAGEAKIPAHQVSWRKRRAMLEQIYSELFPSLDPYDTMNQVYLNDYAIEGKDDVLKSYNGFYLCRDIHAQVSAVSYIGGHEGV